MGPVRCRGGQARGRRAARTAAVVRDTVPGPATPGCSRPSPHTTGRTRGRRPVQFDTRLLVTGRGVLGTASGPASELARRRADADRPLARDMRCGPMALPSSLRYSLLPRILNDELSAMPAGPTGMTPAQICCGPITCVFSSMYRKSLPVPADPARGKRPCLRGREPLPFPLRPRALHAEGGRARLQLNRQRRQGRQRAAGEHDRPDAPFEEVAHGHARVEAPKR